MSPITLVLLGDIAAGKGTQAKILAEKFKLVLIDTGAFSRKVLTGKSRVSERLSRIRLGKLAPSDIIQDYLKKSFTKLSASQSVLVDGGKMPAEAKLIYRIFTKQKRQILVIYLQISRREIFRRLRFRYYCQKTGKPVTVKDNKACPHCGGKLIKRADDDPEAIKNRIDYYDRIYSKTVKFWQEKKALKKINGNQPIPKVTKDIVRAIKIYYSERMNMV